MISDLADAVASAVDNDTSRAAMINGINAGILNIDQALGNSLNIQTQVGSRLAAIDNQEDSNSAFAITLQEALSSIEDLDYAEALSRLSLQVTVLEAAQQSFIRAQNLSLFNYF